MQFPPEEIEQFHAVKFAFDPDGLLNPAKRCPRSSAALSLALCTFTTAICPSHISEVLAKCPTDDASALRDAVVAARASGEKISIQGAGTKGQSVAPLKAGRSTCATIVVWCPLAYRVGHHGEKRYNHR